MCLRSRLAPGGLRRHFHGSARKAVLSHFDGRRGLSSARSVAPWPVEPQANPHAKWSSRMSPVMLPHSCVDPGPALLGTLTRRWVPMRQCTWRAALECLASHALRRTQNVVCHMSRPMIGSNAQVRCTDHSEMPFLAVAHVSYNVQCLPTAREPTARAAKGCPPPFTRDRQPNLRWQGAKRRRHRRQGHARLPARDHAPAW
jgi:hypothetical protein